MTLAQRRIDRDHDLIASVFRKSCVDLPLQRLQYGRRTNLAGLSAYAFPG